jgi:hypothetical protein
MRRDTTVESVLTEPKIQRGFKRTGNMLGGFWHEANPGEGIQEK